MTPLALELIEAHFSAPALPVQFYECLAALMMLAELAERHRFTEQEYNALAAQLRAIREA